MSSPIVFEGDGPPRSRLYDDIYFSRDDGLAEARTVFLAGCGLPERWAGRRHFTVAELGFGTGLNILALLDLWRDAGPADGRLSIFSVEAHPLTPADAERALAGWPELADLSRALLDRWPGRSHGIHRVDLPEFRAVLDVAVMDAAEALEAWGGLADAWFLDGFAPARNPAMWSAPLMAKLAARSAPGAVAATYTVAGEVRRNLTAAGFAVERRPGFGAKRERLVATAAGATAAEPPDPRIAIVGAGIAGASLARAFAALGVEPQVFDAEGPGAGASGNPAALVTPGLDAGLGSTARLHAAGFRRAVALYRSATSAVIAEGALQLEGQGRDAARFAKVLGADLFEPGSIAPLSSEQASERLSETVPGGLALAQAVVVDPRAVLAQWLPQASRQRVIRLEPDAGGWRPVFADGQEATADVVCLAVGAGLAALWPEAPIVPVRGQVSWVDGAAAPTAAAWGAYVAPTAGGVMFGATHDRGQTAADPRQSDDARNLAALASRLPKLAANLAGAAVQGRASVRATVADSLPLAGEIAPGLFVLGALGSRGFSLAPLLAEHLAAVALGTPSPLPTPLARRLDPGRFAERVRRRSGGG